MKRGVPTMLELELSAVTPRGSMSRRMTSIFCHYRMSGETAFTSLPMTSTDIDSRHLIARCTIPPVSDSAAAAVEYYFDFDFDGPHHNRHGSPGEPVRVPLQ